MPVERQFLGWDGPALSRVVDVLFERYSDRLDEPIVVLPTARAGRRLVECLVERAGGAISALPTIETIGRFPERLYDPPRPIADDWTAMLTRVSSLQQTDRERLGQITPHVPESHDLLAWWSLAKQLATVSEGLAASAMTLDDVIDRIRRMKLDDTALDRLIALNQIEQHFHEALEQQGLIDRQTARLDAIARGTCRSDQPIVLACIADLSTQQARMVELLAPGTSVLVLIQASGETSGGGASGGGFDHLGRYLVDYWRSQPLPIEEAKLHFVDRPSDQARCAATLLAAHAPSPDEVTIGLGDEAMADTMRRTLEHAGAKARYAAGRPWGRSRLSTLLRAIGTFAASQRFDDFASLLRHPDIATYLDQPAAIDDWLTLLDRYANDHLQGRLFGNWLGESDRAAQLKHLWDRVAMLMPDSESVRPLPQWTPPIADALQQVYGERELSRHATEDRDLVASLSTLGQVLRELAQVDPASPAIPDTTFSQAVSLILQRLTAESVPEPGGESAIELMGLLDLPLDDAPYLILTGLNEGNIPASRVADPWLPDSMRTALGLPDNLQRLARDQYFLTILLRSRHVELIAGRLTTTGDPLSPSRLLLACDDEQLVSRITAFYQQEDDVQTERPLLLVPGDRDQFLIPPPELDAPRLTRLSVTAFRDYLACPYRFYLKHILKLKGIDDHVIEMDAMAFGNLAHQALERFAYSDCRASLEAKQIADYLSGKLDQLATEYYGNEPRMALRLQIEQLRSRLNCFATQQAQWASEGWTIMDRQAERLLSTSMIVDGQTLTLVGRVDRIDQHPELGYRILDYKTGDSGFVPEKTHRTGPKGEREWADLQLPLYRDLCEPLGVTGQVALGYINLPKKLEDTGLNLAQWTEEELAEARQQRDTVIRGVLAGCYWPPRQPPTFDDGLSAICADLAFNRETLIAANSFGASGAFGASGGGD